MLFEMHKWEPKKKSAVRCRESGLFLRANFIAKWKFSISVGTVYARKLGMLEQFRSWACVCWLRTCFSAIHRPALLALKLARRRLQRSMEARLPEIDFSPEITSC